MNGKGEASYVNEEERKRKENMAEEMKARMDAIKNAAIEDPEFYTPERVSAMLSSIAGATMAAPRAAAGGAGSGEEKKVQLESTDSKLDRELDTERGLWAMTRQDPRVMTPFAEFLVNPEAFNAWVDPTIKGLYRDWGMEDGADGKIVKGIFDEACLAPGEPITALQGDGPGACMLRKKVWDCSMRFFAVYAYALHEKHHLKHDPKAKPMALEARKAMIEVFFTRAVNPTSTGGDNTVRVLTAALSRAQKTDEATEKAIGQTAKRGHDGDQGGSGKGKGGGGGGGGGVKKENSSPKAKTDASPPRGPKPTSVPPIYASYDEEGKKAWGRGWGLCIRCADHGIIKVGMGRDHRGPDAHH